eukprot:m.213692 g.213692  ORF g.213692 m.213692 type:complete len:327 (-) comp18611_c0_seq2:40-1020(-)
MAPNQQLHRPVRPNPSHQMHSAVQHFGEGLPSVMTIPYVDGTTDVNRAQCATGPAAVVNVYNTDPVTTVEPSLELSCVPGTGALTVDFASFGRPAVQHRNGRFFMCGSADCPPSTLRKTFWEDFDTKLRYEVGSGPCAECLHHRPTCPVANVTGAYFFSLGEALERFSCAVSRDCAAFATNSSCDAGPSVLSNLKSLCDGKQSCSVPVAKLLPAGGPPAGCAPASQRDPLLLAVRASGCQHGTAVASFRQDLAGFLLTRGGHAWMGHNWIAGNRPAWYPEWDVDFGEPLAAPQVSSDGATFTRAWSKFNVSLNCDTFEASFDSVQA